MNYAEFATRIIRRVEAEGIAPNLTPALVDRLKKEAAIEVANLTPEESKELAAGAITGIIVQGLHYATEAAMENLLSQMFKI